MTHFHILGVGAGWEPKRRDPNTDAYTVRERLAKLTKVVAEAGGRVLRRICLMLNRITCGGWLHWEGKLRQPKRR